jgi:hypothetical protein
MNCDQIKDRMIDYISGEMTFNDSLDFERHILECNSCKKLLSELKSTFQMISESTVVENDDESWKDFDRKLFEKVGLNLDEKKIIPFYRMHILAYAASILVAVLSLLAIHNFIKTPDTEMMLNVIYTAKSNNLSLVSMSIDVEPESDYEDYSTDVDNTMVAGLLVSSLGVNVDVVASSLPQISVLSDSQYYFPDDMKENSMLSEMISTLDDSVIDELLQYECDLNSPFDFDSSYYEHSFDDYNNQGSGNNLRISIINAKG